MKEIIDVTILTDALNGHGGEETVLGLFCKYLNSSFKFNVLIPFYGGSDEWISKLKKYASVFCNENTSKLSKYIFLIKVLLNCNSDVLICMTPRLTYLASKIKKFFHKKYKIISWQHFSIYRPTDSSSLDEKKKWYGSADYYFAISSGIKTELISLGIDSKKIYTVFNPVIPSNKYFIETQDEKIHFLCISRIQFNQQKNLKELFDACANLDGNWVLDIYGNDDTADKSEIKKCQNYAKKLNISDKIIWHGWVKDIWSEDIHPSCLVMTSNFEGFPMSLCEAASNGVPLISSDCPTGPSDIVNSNNGFLYTMHNIDELTRLMQRFINRDALFDRDRVKQSISKYYVSNYTKTIQRLINDIISM